MADEPDRGPAERLARLRRRLRQDGLDGLWLPRTDPHGSEYLPPHEERVAWLSGFTGSAAVVVVLPDRAAVFTDGRYTLQVREEVDPRLFEARHLGREPPAKWLARHLQPGQRLGYDPYLVTKAERERIERVCRRRGADLVAVRRNPVDVVWTDRPPPPVGRVAPHELVHAGRASREKRRDIGRAVAELDAEWLVLTATDAICWLLNLRGSDIPFNPVILSFALLHRDGRCRWFVDARKLPPDLRLDEEVAVEPYESFGAALDALARGGEAVVADPRLVRAGFLDRLTAGGRPPLEEEDPVLLAKARKNPVEMEGARRAHRRDGAAVVRVLKWLDEIPLDGSVTELDVVRRLEAERSRDPLYRGPSFETIAGHGPNGAIVHYRVTADRARPLTGGTLLLVDSGGHYPDGTTDITRTVALGRPARAMCEHFTRVLKGHIALATVRFPEGTGGVQLDSLARLPLWAAGLDYDHGTGHGVGSYLCVHEGPQRIAKTGSAVALEPGMILSDEPGCYRVGAYGIRIENLLLVRPCEEASEGGERPLLEFETLTLAPIDRRLILPELLTAGERAWLDAYHLRVRESLSPALDAEHRAWLEAACAPL